MRAMKVIAILLTGAGLASLVWLVYMIKMEIAFDHELYRSIRVQGRDDRGRMIIDMKKSHSVTFGVSEKPGAEITLQKNSDDFWVNAKIHADVVLEDVSIWYGERSVPYEGTSFKDTRGQRWELVSRDLSGSEFYKKHPDLLLGQRFWSGNIHTDGKSVFFHVGENRETVREIWKLIPE